MYLFGDSLGKEYFVRVGEVNIWRERGKRIFGESGGENIWREWGERIFGESDEREYLARV